MLEAMKAQNDGKWFQHFTFKQKTLFFDKTGKQTSSAIWHEAVSYPYNFRIDRDLKNKSYTIYRNDSTYHILNDTLYMALAEPAKHLIYKGGLYFISLEEAMEKLNRYGYNTEIFRRAMFMKEPVFIVGDEKNQFWLHAKNFYCMRRISTNNEGKSTDIVYEDFKSLGDGWVEQKVTFYFDGKKRMEEFYFDIKINEDMDPKTYEIDCLY